MFNSLFEDWMLQSKCANDDALQIFMKEYPQYDFFHDKQTQELAKQYCFGCPVFDLCRSQAMKHVVGYSTNAMETYSGVMGGLTLRERRSEKKKLDRVLLDFQARWKAQLPDEKDPIAS